MAFHGPHFTTDEHRSKIIPIQRLRQVKDGLGFTGSQDQQSSKRQAAAYAHNPKIPSNHWFIYGFLLHPLTQGRNWRIPPACSFGNLEMYLPDHRFDLLDLGQIGQVFSCSWGISLFRQN